MKRSRRFPDEATRIGHILFWLFPYEQDALGNRKARGNRGTQTPTRKERLGHMIGVLGRAPSTPKSGRGLALFIASLILSSFLADSNCAQVTKPNQGSQPTHCMALAAGPAENHVADGSSGKTSSEVAATDRSDQSDSKPTFLSLTTSGNDSDSSGTSTGPSTATGEIAKDLTTCSAFASLQSSALVSDVPARDSDSASGNLLTSVVEQVFTGKAGDNQVAELDVLNSGHANPVFQDSVYTPSEPLEVPAFIPGSSGGPLQ